MFNPNELVVVLYFTAIKQHYHYIYVLWFPYLYYFKLSDVKNFIFAKHKGQSGDKYIFALRLGNIPCHTTRVLLYSKHYRALFRARDRSNFLDYPVNRKPSLS